MTDDSTPVFCGILRVVSSVITVLQPKTPGWLATDGSCFDWLPNSMPGFHELVEFRFGDPGCRVLEPSRASLEFAAVAVPPRVRIHSTSWR